MARTFDTIMKELKKKIYHPVYFLTGEETYYIDKICDFIEDNVLEDSEKEFNQSVLYGKEVNISTLLSYAKRYPMMSNYQVVIVKEAQEMKDLFPKGKQSRDDDGDSADSGPSLLSYLKNPQPTTLLVFCYKYKSVDGRTKLGKTIASDTVFFKSSKIYDDKIPAWVSTYVEDKKYKIGSKASFMLADFLGNDLSKISNELDKLMINVDKGAEITPELIEKFIGISKDYNIFEMQNAIGKKDYFKAQRIASYFGANPKASPLPVTMSLLYSYFNRVITYHSMIRSQRGIARDKVAAALGINPFFLKDIEIAARNYSYADAVKAIDLLHKYDLKSKGVGNVSTDSSDLIREMIFKIMHPEQVVA